MKQVYNSLFLGLVVAFAFMLTGCNNKCCDKPACSDKPACTCCEKDCHCKDGGKCCCNGKCKPVCDCECCCCKAKVENAEKKPACGQSGCSSQGCKK